MLKTCECTACMYVLSHNDRLLEEKILIKLQITVLVDLNKYELARSIIKDV